MHPMESAGNAYLVEALIHAAIGKDLAEKIASHNVRLSAV